MINILMVALALAWPLGQLLELPSFYPGLRFYALDLLALLFLITLKPAKIIRDPLFKPIGLFFLAAALSLVIQIPRLDLDRLLISTAYLLRWLAYTAIYFHLRLLPKLQLIKPLIFSLSIFTLLGLLQYLFMPDTRFLKNFGFDDHYYRLIGTMLDPHFTGAILGTFIIILFQLLPSWSKLVSLIPLAALALTFSRSSYLAFAVGLIYLLLSRPKKIYLVFLLLPLFIFLAPKPFGEGVNLLRTFSIEARLQSIRQGLDLFKASPLFGQGFNTLRAASDSFYPHRAAASLPNSFIFVLATTGLIGFFTFLTLLIQALKLSRRTPYATACLLLLFTHALFNHSLFYPWLLTLFWVLLNLASRKIT